MGVLRARPAALLRRVLEYQVLYDHTGRCHVFAMNETLSATFFLPFGGPSSEGPLFAWKLNGADGCVTEARK